MVDPRPTDPLPIDPPPTDALPIEQIGPDIHRHVARVLSTCFGVRLDAELERWCDAVMAEPTRTTYAAFDGWTIVAVSSLVLDRGGAALAGAATLPEWRDRGLHAAMVARRLEDAARLGLEQVADPPGWHRRP